MRLVTTTNTTFSALLVATALVGIPMSVFAQTNDVPVENVELAATSTSTSVVETQQRGEVVDTATQLRNRYPDTYKREPLPYDDVYDDFVIGPGRFDLQLAPGESQTVMMTVTNRMGEGKVFSFTTEDVASSEDPSSTIALLGDEVGPYTIKDYISVPYERFYLEHGRRAVIPVTVSIPADAEPGGFYGSILTEVVTSESGQAGGQVNTATPIISRVGTLFYVVTPGEVDRDGELIELTTVPKRRLYLSGPVDFGIVFENTGSVHLTPQGSLSITNIFGDEVGIVDLPPWFVLPGSLRTREITWNREFLIGRYKAQVTLDRGYDGLVDEASYVFWVIPWKFMVFTFGGLFLFFLVIRFFARNFEFKRKS